MESLPGSEALLTIAEILVALSASTGIILALTKDPEHWQPFDAARVFILLATSLGGTFLSVLPFGLHFAGVSEDGVWRVASGAMALLVVVGNGFALRMFGSLFRTSRRYFSVWLTASVSIIGLLNLGVQLLNSLAIVFSGIFSVFLGGLIWFVALSSLLFILIVFNRPRSAD